MNFNLNSGFLFLVAFIVVVFVLAQSFFFLIKAVRQAKKMKLSPDVVKSTILSSAVFTIAPAISILLGVISLSKFLGLPLPWIRLSILGALTYELTAAASAAASVGVVVTEQITDPKAFTTIVWVMTIGIIPSVVLIPLFLKKIQGGIVRVKNKDLKWGDLFITAIFLGMISAFLGVVFAEIRSGLQGWIPVFVLLFSALIMMICGLLLKKYKVKWIEDYALPFSILGAMAFSIFITNLIG
ncbi:DUF5058 family protein [Alkaliphilus peptidifermentans]|uniref:DUF5058 domain-containing protein n=1 Tax=Alkaliphilus peptidifermentans DSM 18978 TaxID=1120976 RepID=A0A1G5J033_9FIRM|nr:DUF5058 family protein [Alkaliphilus peptidifermentans]SCY81696.1 protein of unknown function [Alkaliphilus peptidifermentans DSM 18978]